MFSLKLSMVGIFSPLGPKFKRERLWFLSTKLARILEVGVSRGYLGKDSPMMWKNEHTEKSRLILSKQGNPSSGNEKKKKSRVLIKQGKFCWGEACQQRWLWTNTTVPCLRERWLLQTEGGYRCLRGLMVRGAAMHQHCECKSLIHRSRRLQSPDSRRLQSPGSRRLQSPGSRRLQQCDCLRSHVQHRVCQPRQTQKATLKQKSFIWNRIIVIWDLQNQIVTQRVS